MLQPYLVQFSVLVWLQHVLQWGSILVCDAFPFPAGSFCFVWSFFDCCWFFLSPHLFATALLAWITMSFSLSNVLGPHVFIIIANLFVAPYWRFAIRFS